MNKALNKAIELLGGRTALAKAIGMTPMAISYWVNGKPMLPSSAVKIEQATGGKVKRADLLWPGD